MQYHFGATKLMELLYLNVYFLPCVKKQVEYIKVVWVELAHGMRFISRTHFINHVSRLSVKGVF